MTNAERTLTRTERNLWNAIVSEAMAYLKYTAYAHHALQEGHPEVAQIFQEVAGAETIHGINHLKVAGEIKPSMENLRSVVKGESKEISTMYPRYVRDALDDGRTDAAQTFMMAMDREQHHLEVFNKAIEELEAKLGDQQAESEVQTEDQHREHVGAPRPLSQVAEAQVNPSFVAARTELESARWRVASMGRIREVVFGGQDGLLSTMLLVTALAVGDLERTAVLVGGLAGALAGLISMSTGAYLGSKAQRDLQRAEIEQEARELEEHPGEELAELVVIYQQEGLSYEDAQGVAEHIAADKDLWLRTMVEKELGISPQLTSNPIKDALVMGAAFTVGAIIPVIPFFFSKSGTAIGVAVGATLVALFVLGMGKGRIVQRSPVFQGLEILLVGAAAAAVGWGLGEGIPRIV